MMGIFDERPEVCSGPFRLRMTRYLLFLAILASPFLTGRAFAQSDSPDVSALRVSDQPGFLIVIFSPEVDTSNRTAAQGAVWKAFIDRLKKKKVNALEVVNEVAINDGADRARAFELAAGEQAKFTIWLQFSSLVEAADNSRRSTTSAERLAAKYTVFPPAGSEMIGQGEIEQERIAESQFGTVNNQKVMRDNSGRVINARTPVSLPDGSSTNGPKTMDIDALRRVGEQVADRAISAVKSYQKKIKSP